MAGSKEIKRRIESVKNTQQITSAMKMVSASKLRKVQTMVGQGDLYRERLRAMLFNVADSVENKENIPYLKTREVKRAAILVITSNKGLCGGYNNHLLNEALALYEAKKASGIEVEIIAIGKKADEFFTRKQITIKKAFLDFSDVPKREESEYLSEYLKEAFLEEVYDEIHIAYQSFVSAISQVPKTFKLLPIVYEDKVEKEGGYKPDYWFEPESDVILEDLLALYFKMMIETALIEARAGEHGARMSAMTATSDNATELLQDLKLSYNRARQAAITNEITEIVAGVNALD